MTPRERVLAILAGRRPDAVPWFGDLDYWATSLINRGLRPADFKTKDSYIQWHQELGVGFYLQGYFPFKTIIENCGVKEWRNGHDRFRQLDTPRGILRECWRWLPDSFAEAPTERLIKSAADLPAYRCLHRNIRYEPDYEFAERRRSQVGEMGIVLAYLPKSPFMQLVALDAGIMTVAEMSADAIDEFDETIAVVRESHDRASSMALRSPAEVLMIPENLSSEVVGRRLYERYMRDYHETWTREIHKAGKFSCVHLDGTLKGLLREVSSAGFTFIEAMTPAPVGDLEVGKWAAWSGHEKTIFWGGLPGVYFTDKVTDAEFDRHVIGVLQVMRREPRYVLGVADQVPPDGLEYRVRRVSRLVEEYGVYEIAEK